VHGAAQAPTNPLNIRGICVNPSGSGQTVDIIFTIQSWMTNPDPTGLLYHWPTAKDIAAAIAADPGVIARFRGLSMNGYAWLQLTGPASAVDFWRAQPILWDRNLGDGKIGGPTQAFADRSGAYIGAADDGISLQGMPGSGKLPIGPGNEKSSSGTTALWVLGGIGAIGAIWYFTREQRRQ